jgi:phosphoribosyl 1,2-cyclic phosphate phosphodiesterase
MVFLVIVIPKNKKNYRTRCSALIKSKAENILIDTSPDLRQQLLRHNIKKIDKVFYSHMHADQTHGINDLRSFYINSRNK